MCGPAKPLLRGQEWTPRGTHKCLLLLRGPDTPINNQSNQGSLQAGGKDQSKEGGYLKGFGRRMSGGAGRGGRALLREVDKGLCLHSLKDSRVGGTG